MTSTKRIEWLFIDVIPDPVTRRNKLRMMFRGKFYRGDDVLLRIIYEFLKRRSAIAARITRKYQNELKRYGYGEM